MLSIYFFRCFFYCCMCVCVVKMDLILVGRYFAFVSRQLINGYENPEMPSLYSSLTTHKHSIFYSVYAFRFELSLTAMIAQYISFAFVIFFCFVFFFLFSVLSLSTIGWYSCAIAFDTFVVAFHNPWIVSDLRRLFKRNKFFALTLSVYVIYPA